MPRHRSIKPIAQTQEEELRRFRRLPKKTASVRRDVRQVREAEEMLSKLTPKLKAKVSPPPVTKKDKSTQRKQGAKIGVEAAIDALPTPKTVTKPARKPVSKPTRKRASSPVAKAMPVPEQAAKQATMPKLKKQTSVKDRKTTLSAAMTAGHLYYYKNGVKTAAVTKDMLKKFGFKSLRDFMNAQLGKKRKSK